MKTVNIADSYSIRGHHNLIPIVSYGSHIVRKGYVIPRLAARAFQATFPNDIASIQYIISPISCREEIIAINYQVRNEHGPRAEDVPGFQDREARYVRAMSATMVVYDFDQKTILAIS